MSDSEYSYSISATSQLTDAIYDQHQSLRIDHERQDDIMSEIKKMKNQKFKELQELIKNESSDSTVKIIELASEKGASCWLTSLPLKNYGFRLNKQEFQDAICLRYNFNIKDTARTCVWGEDYSINHCLTCK